jgi:hypothetical protein
MEVFDAKLYIVAEVLNSLTKLEYDRKIPKINTYRDSQLEILALNDNPSFSEPANSIICNYE